MPEYTTTIFRCVDKGAGCSATPRFGTYVAVSTVTSSIPNSEFNLPDVCTYFPRFKGHSTIVIWMQSYVRQNTCITYSEHLKSIFIVYQLEIKH